jgi:hypothetical protein
VLLLLHELASSVLLCGHILFAILGSNCAELQCDFPSACFK